MILITPALIPALPHATISILEFEIVGNSEDVMAESQEVDNGYVACTRCNGEGCELSRITDSKEECSTMHYAMAAAAFECAVDDRHILPECGEESSHDWEHLVTAA